MSIEERLLVGGLLTVLDQNRLDLAVTLEDLDELGAAIPRKTDNAGTNFLAHSSPLNPL